MDRRTSTACSDSDSDSGSGSGSGSATDSGSGSGSGSATDSGSGSGSGSTTGSGSGSGTGSGSGSGSGTGSGSGFGSGTALVRFRNGFWFGLWLRNGFWFGLWLRNGFWFRNGLWFWFRFWSVPGQVLVRALAWVPERVLVRAPVSVLGLALLGCEWLGLAVSTLFVGLGMGSPVPGRSLQTRPCFRQSRFGFCQNGLCFSIEFCRRKAAIRGRGGGRWRHGCWRWRVAASTLRSVA